MVRPWLALVGVPVFANATSCSGNGRGLRFMGLWGIIVGVLLEKKILEKRGG